jgi:hypothetical protein
MQKFIFNLFIIIIYSKLLYTGDKNHIIKPKIIKSNQATRKIKLGRKKYKKLGIEQRLGSYGKAPR